MRTARTRWLRVFAVVLAAMPGLGLAQQITFQTPGADESLSQELRNASLLLATAEEESVSAQDLVAAARAEYGRLVGVLYANGRYSGVVNVTVDGREAATIPTIASPDSVARITVHVEPGPLFQFSRARITPRAPGTSLPDAYAPGEPARASAVQDAVSAGVTGWRDVGHAKAELAGQDVVADHSAERLAAEVRLAPGPRVRFGDLRITGNERVRTERIRAIAGFPAGAVFSPEELEESANRLQRTGTFSSVALREAKTLDAGNHLDVTATVTEEEPRRLGFGAEISSVEGLRLSAYWLHRNYLGGAERLRISGDVSGIGGSSGGLDYDFGARFDRPATFTPDTSLFLEAGIQRLEEPEFTSDNAEIAAGVSRIFSDTLEGETAVSLSYASVEDDLGEREFTLLGLPSELLWDRRNSELDATDGTYLSVAARPYLAVGEGDSGARLLFDARAYEGFGDDDRVVIAGRAQLGSILFSDLRQTRPDYLFFSGGAGTVRGHEYQSLGVDLGDGDEIGGRSFLGLSGEVRVGVTERIGLVGFYDAGFIGADSVPGDDGDWQSGAGLGLRYDTGVGPIRLDVATPVTGDDDNTVAVYVGIGQAF